MVFPAQAVRCILNDVFPNTSRISNRKKWSDGVAKSIRELHGRDGTIFIEGRYYGEIGKVSDGKESSLHVTL